MLDSGDLDTEEVNPLEKRSSNELSAQTKFIRKKTAIFKNDDSPQEKGNDISSDEDEHLSKDELSPESSDVGLPKKKKRARNPIRSTEGDEDEDGVLMGDSIVKKASRETINIFNNKSQGSLYDSHSELDSEGDNQLQNQKRQKNERRKRQNRIADDKKMVAINSNKSGENVNFKRSIEIRSGIAIRSTNNVHKMTNAITLHCYIVS